MYLKIYLKHLKIYLDLGIIYTLLERGKLSAVIDVGVSPPFNLSEQGITYPALTAEVPQSRSDDKIPWGWGKCGTKGKRPFEASMQGPVHPAPVASGTGQLLQEVIKAN